MMDLMSYSAEFENMVKASLNGYEFSLQYIQDTILTIINQNKISSNYVLIKSEYNPDDVFLKIYSLSGTKNQFICVNLLLSICPKEKIENFAEYRTKKILIELKIPFNDNKDDRSYTVKYYFVNKECSNDCFTSTYCNRELIYCYNSMGSFSEMIEAIVEQIDEFCTEYKIEDEDSKKDKTTSDENKLLNEFDNTYTALKEIVTEE